MLGRVKTRDLLFLGNTETEDRFYYNKYDEHSDRCPGCNRYKADELDLELLDTDQAIEEAEGRTINEIFVKEGEEAFRSMETDLLDMVVSEHLNGMVVSLGGGLPLREENRTLLKKAGKIVYLRTQPETVFERLKGDDTRPLLKTEDPLKRIKELLSERSDKYETLADIIVDTDGKDASDIAQEIIAAIGL